MPDRVLLTGVSGFLGGHVASALLAAGYQVRGSVRNLAKADKVRETLAKAGADVSRLEFVALDLLKDDGWDAAARGLPLSRSTPPRPSCFEMPTDKMELIRPAIEGTERALNAGLKAGVERIVLTSSMAAIAYGHDRAPHRAVHRRRLDRSRRPRRQRLHRIEDPRRAARLGDHEGGGARGRSRRNQPERHLRSAARRRPRHFGAAGQASARRRHARRAALHLRRSSTCATSPPPMSRR